MELGLRGLRALVTGATRGIGHAIAEALAREGCDLGFCARNPQQVEATVAALSVHGPRIHGEVADAADEAALTTFVDSCAAELGGLDIIVANVSAFVIGEDSPDWRRSLTTDVLGTVALVEAARPHLARSEHGAILVVSSTAAREIDFAARPYGAGKAALAHYAKGLAVALGPAGIRVNTLTPGHTYFPGGGWERIAREDPDLYERSLAACPLGRMAAPEEIARAAVFLVSPAASFVAGANLLADGGLTRAVGL